MSEKLKTVVWSLVLAGLLVLCSVSWGAVISLTGDASGMTLKSGDTLKLNGHTVNGQVTVAGSNVTISGPGRIRVAPGNSTDKTKRTKGILINSPNINNVTIEDLEISGDGVKTGVIGERGIQALDGNSNLTIRGVTIRNIMVPILLRSHNNVLIEHCKFGPNNITNSSDHCEAISDRNSNDVTIRYCEFFNIRNSGIIVSGNDAQRLGGNAYRWKIYHNVFWYSPDYPALGIGAGAQHGFAACYNGQPAIDWEVHNNTSVNHYGYDAGVDLEKPTNAKIYDNLWYSLGKDPEGRTAGLNVASGSNGNLLASSNPFAGDWTKGDFTRKPGVTAGAAWPFVGGGGPVETPKPDPTAEPTPVVTPEPTATPVAERPVLVLYDAQLARVGRILGDEWMQVGFEEGEYSVAAEPGAGVSRVRFYVDGALVNEEGAVPYMLGGDWATRYWAPGEYEIGVSYLASAGWGEVMAETLWVMPKAVVTPEPTAEPTPEPTATPGPVDCAEVEARLALALAANEALTRRVAEVEWEKAAVEERLGEVEAERDALRGVVEAVKAAVGGGT